MVNYYYAIDRKEENGVEYLKVPMMVNPETAGENGQRVCMVRIGWKHYLCAYVWIPASYYMIHKRMLEQEAKTEERAHRCLISDGQGGKIMCPETNLCSECPLRLKDSFDNGHATSLDTLLENGHDSESGESKESAFDIEDGAVTGEQKVIAEEELRLIDELSRKIIDRLSEKNPKYGLIFRELLKGIKKPSDIARNTGLKPNRTCEDVPKVQALAAKLYKEFKE